MVEWEREGDRESLCVCFGMSNKFGSYTGYFQYCGTLFSEKCWFLFSRHLVWFDSGCRFCLAFYSSVQSLSRVRLFATPWTAALQASLSITNSRSLLKLTSTESGMPSSHLILCRPLLLSPSVFPTIRVFSDESALRIRWPKDWSFSFNIRPFSECSGLISFRMDWLDPLQSKGLSRVFSNTTVQKHQFFGAQLSL